MDQKQLEFRKLLFRISEKLSRQDFEALTFICRDVISVSRMERIRSATELFQALTERGKLSSKDLTYFTRLLTTIGKESLLLDLKTAGYSVPLSPSLPTRDYLLQECLVKIAQGLSSTEVDRLIFVLLDPLHQSPDKIFSATQLFQLLQQRQCITCTNLRPLYDALLELGRVDLTTHINTYLQLANLPSYQSIENNGMSRQEPFAPPFPPHLVGASTPSSGVASYPHASISSSGDSTLASDHSDLTSIEESSREGGGGATLLVSPRAAEPIAPFGLKYIFEEDNESQQTQLFHSLAVKEGELRYKEQEIERLQRELSEQVQRGDRVMEERAGDRDFYSKSIQELQAHLTIKNQEVASLVRELQDYHQQMAAMQASSPVKEEDLYKMDKQPHGLCLIFNNYEFHHPFDMEKAHPSRGGANVDQFNLTQTFKYLRYEVIVKENLTAQQMQDTLFEIAHRDHKGYDSFVCCILTHGETNVVHGADSQEVDLLHFAATMKLSPPLREKPKMFFVQACRGEGESKGYEIQKDSGGAQPSITATIPQEADFFFGYATPTGNAAYRSKRHGSWYISELCKVLTQHAYTHNLSSMMKKVNYQVSKAYTKEGFKQCPEYVDRLRKEVHFFHFLKGQL